MPRKRKHNTCRYSYTTPLELESGVEKEMGKVEVEREMGTEGVEKAMREKGVEKEMGKEVVKKEIE